MAQTTKLTGAVIVFFNILYIFGAVDPFATKVNLMLHHNRQECLGEKIRLSHIGLTLPPTFS